jgi:hypothetical protein
MRLTLPFLLLAVAACAGNPAPDDGVETADVGTMHVGGTAGGSNLHVRSAADANVVIIAAPKETVWPLLLAAFDSVGLTADPTLTSRKEFVISSGTLNIRRQLGKTYLSKYIDCGSTQIGASADSYQIALQVTSRLVTQPAGTTGVSTLVEAAGKPVNFSQEYQACSTTSRLETLIGDIVRSKLK